MPSAEAIQIHWHHEFAPIYSIDYYSSLSKIATAGGDYRIRIWKVDWLSSGSSKVRYLATLNQHTQAVNAVRFSQKLGALASAGDDGLLLIWKQTDSISSLENETEDEKEYWKVARRCQTQSNAEIYDIAWSPCEQLIISGSLDFKIRISDAQSGQLLKVIEEHNNFVQGVAWNPKNNMFASQSSDRSVIFHFLDTKKFLQNPKEPMQHFKSSKITTGNGSKPNSLYLSESLNSFFRRLNFSPDGNLLYAPAGQCKVNGSESTEQANCVYIYVSSGFRKPPALMLPGMTRPAIAVKWSPKFYKLKNSKTEPLFDLPYRMICAVILQDSVLIYDTQHPEPLFSINNLHFGTLTDATWSCCGYHMLVSSTDGFCSYISFTKDELGETEAAPMITEEVDTHAEIVSPSKKEENLTSNTYENVRPANDGKKRIALTHLGNAPPC